MIIRIFPATAAPIPHLEPRPRVLPRLPRSCATHPRRRGRARDRESIRNSSSAASNVGRASVRRWAASCARRRVACHAGSISCRWRTAASCRSILHAHTRGDVARKCLLPRSLRWWRSNSFRVALTAATPPRDRPAPGARATEASTRRCGTRSARASATTAGRAATYVPSHQRPITRDTCSERRHPGGLGPRQVSVSRTPAGVAAGLAIRPSPVRPLPAPPRGSDASASRRSRSVPRRPTTGSERRPTGPPRR